MISRSTPSESPPFPSDVPTAPIARISLRKLLQGDDGEAAVALEACRTYGFFYLDLTSTTVGEGLLDQAESLHSLAKELFARPSSYKDPYELIKGKSLFGYKKAGTVKQTDVNQRPDSTEFFNVAKDHFNGVTESRTYPPEIASSRQLFQSFQKNSHNVCMVVLRVLAGQLALPSDAFVDKNIFSEPSGDHVRLTHKVPHPTDKNAIGLPSHTDFGSITLLFNWLGGLQIQSHDPEKNGEWEFVKPLDGHAIINLGDAMVTFTNGFLKSAKHRVIPAPGEQVEVPRYSIVYFVRPHNSVMMEPLDKFRAIADSVKVAGKFEPEGDGILTAGEWMVQRAKQMGS